jgi:hypothetical protein
MKTYFGIKLIKQMIAGCGSGWADYFILEKIFVVRQKGE